MIFYTKWPMKDETKKLLKQVGLASTLGLSVAFAIFIGAGLGFWLDSTLGTFPWLTLVFLIMGVVAGFRNYYRFMRKQQREDERKP
ncbi:Putative F0F1-ATPase subunit Ca2+/Mg2+ transporter [Desulfacinum hydrothermale DSM 13146]|uniref:Putative F0F1-ATPase subunit Ca2+/Mg2+ transporter n=2 Tax=Desulfacinum hydrothermale TaxID=109258 RepID=A0A1W1XKH6_9BACT|nr:Putative F0F1-ATPase subunit Ca2+/Mg2+ transporter [Desulfacinum hydrothermale DSM 13146]